jgi:hypothetical protein
MPAVTSCSKRRAAPPSCVKIAAPLPYGLELMTSSASG